MKKFAVAVLLLCLVGATSIAAANEDCRAQKINSSKIEMCLKRGGNFQHDTYILKADNAVIFALTDDYAEDVQLVHTIPPGPAIEYPLSLQGAPAIKISGGCVPVSKDGAEVARVCNFSWGAQQVVKDVRFAFD